MTGPVEMNAGPDLSRIGSVPYLNSRLLVYGLESKITFAVPSELARRLRLGQLDCALVPVVEYLEHPRYLILPGGTISCRGPVRSVYLAYRGPLSRVRRVFLDPSSKTSSFLLQVILGEFFGLEVEFPLGEAGPDQPRLLIGDPALEARAGLQAGGWNLLDLGETWHDTTGLPFVFAFWLVREGLDAAPYHQTLSRALREGRRNIEAVVASEKRFPAKMTRSYLTEAIRHDLGPDEISGIREFQRLLRKRGLISGEHELKLAA